jgi:hypothetical protein
VFITTYDFDALLRKQNVQRENGITPFLQILKREKLASLGMQIGGRLISCTLHREQRVDT